MEGIITWNFFLVGFLTELCLYMFKIIIRHLTLENLLIILKLFIICVIALVNA